MKIISMCMLGLIITCFLPFESIAQDIYRTLKNTGITFSLPEIWDITGEISEGGGQIPFFSNPSRSATISNSYAAVPSGMDLTSVRLGHEAALNKEPEKIIPQQESTFLGLPCYIYIVATNDWGKRNPRIICFSKIIKCII